MEILKFGDFINEDRDAELAKQKAETKEETVTTVSQMSFSDFQKKYIELAKYAKESEKKGKLDQNDPSYVPMTKDEELLLQSNWKEFSRGRGFSEADINKYSEWLKISGQKDSVIGAINDPWRRGKMSGDDVNLDFVEYIYNSIKQAELKALEESSKTDI